MYWPAAAELEAVSVSTIELVVGLGEKDASTPLGKPATENLTLPVNPNCGDTLTLPVVELPWPRLICSGPHNVKDGAATVT